MQSDEAQHSYSLIHLLKLFFKKAGLFFKNYETFQDGTSRALNQAWGPGACPRSWPCAEVFIHSFSRQWGFCARYESQELTNAKAHQVWYTGGTQETAPSLSRKPRDIIHQVSSSPFTHKKTEAGPS